MNEFTMVALRCLIMLIATAITMVLIPYIRSKIGDDRWRELQEITEFAVRYAEQVYTPEEWEMKKSYVYNYILNKSHEMGLNLTEQDIDVLVEGFVNSVKHG